MIYEERLTLTSAKSAEAYLEYAQNERQPQLRTVGGEPLCLFSGLIGDPANQYLQVTAFEDVMAWETAQSRVGPAPSDMVENESVRLLTSISSRPKNPVPKEDQRAVYGCRRFVIDPANLADFVDSSQNGIWPRIESQGACILGLWTTVAATQPMETLLLTGYHSPSHWEETRVTSSQQSEVDRELRAQESPLRDRRIDISQQQWVRLMKAWWE